MRKKFDKELHDQTDPPARKKAKSILKKLGYTAIDNPNRVGVDLFVYKGDEHIFNMECEVKIVWEKDFPYDSVQFPERKTKYTKLDKRTYFIMFNKNLSQYLVVKDSDIASSPLKMIRNSYVKFGEYFFQVPLTKVSFNEIRI